MRPKGAASSVSDEISHTLIIFNSKTIYVVKNFVKYEGIISPIAENTDNDPECLKERFGMIFKANIM